MLYETQPVALSALGVRVFVRLRPPAEDNGIQIFDHTRNSAGILTIKDPLSACRSEHTYEFDGIFRPEQSQEQVFTPVAGPIVRAAAQGYSGCVLAYGQTGSGKTYSIFGEGANGSSRGLLPRAMEVLFDGWQNQQDQHFKDITVSFMEVYLDKVLDLARSNECSLDDSLVDVETIRSSVGKPPRATPNRSLGSGDVSRTSNGPQRGRSKDNVIEERDGLEIREGPNGVHVKGLSHVPAQDIAEVQQIIERGLSRRATARTGANTQSSRSHTVFTVHLPMPSDSPSAQVEEHEGSKEFVSLSFVDLAGSERLAKSKAEGPRFHEAVSINSTLTALGKVVLALSSPPSSTRHIPYRDSKLTRLLAPSLSGGAHVTLLATIHPQAEDYGESLNTLSFAYRCKNVGKQPQVNYVASKKSSQMKISDLQAQIVQLKEDLNKAQRATAAHMKNCGITGIGGVGKDRKVDEVDVAIAKAIMTDGNDVVRRAEPSFKKLASRESESEPSSPKTALSMLDYQKLHQEAKERARANRVAALLELQDERARQQEAHGRAEERLLQLERERDQISKLEEQRVTDSAELKQRGADLEVELLTVQQRLQEVVNAQNFEHAQAVQNFKESSEKRHQEADATLHRIPTDLRKRLEMDKLKGEEAEIKRRELDEQHVKNVRQMKQDQDKEISELESHWKERINSCETLNKQYAQDLNELKAEHHKLEHQCQLELVSLYEVITKLAKLISDTEDGKHPIVRRAGLKEVVLPEGSKPTMPKPQTHVQLFDALENEERPSSTDRVDRRSLSSSRVRRVGSGGIAAVAAAEAMRGVEQKDASSNLGAVGTTALAVNIREAEDEKQVQNIISELSVEQLRQICIELRDCALRNFAPGRERESFRRQAMNGLDNQATANYVRELETRCSAERAALSDAVDRGRQLRNFLGSRKSSPAFTPQQGMSRVGSRSLSLGGRSRPDSRASSRPGTASRPPAAPASMSSAHAQ